VPHLPVGLVVEHPCPRGVRRPPFGDAGPLVDRRAHQRVTEGNPCAVRSDEPGVDGRGEVLHRRSTAVAGRCGGEDLAKHAVVGRGEQQQRARGRRQRNGLNGESPLQPFGQRQRRRQ